MSAPLQVPVRFPQSPHHPLTDCRPLSITASYHKSVPVWIRSFLLKIPVLSDTAARRRKTKADKKISFFSVPQVLLFLHHIFDTMRHRRFPIFPLIYFRSCGSLQTIRSALNSGVHPVIFPEYTAICLHHPTFLTGCGSNVLHYAFQGKTFCYHPFAESTPGS